MRTPATQPQSASLEEALAALDGELPTVTREHMRVTVEGFLAAAGAESERCKEQSPLRVSLFPDRLRIEGKVVRQHHAPSTPPLLKGRGLDLVEQLADRWGIVEGEPLGFWFELDRR